MIYQAQKKVTGGKFVRIKLIANEYITDLQITGDFFLHPEEAIGLIEQNLRNLHIQTSNEEIEERIHAALAKSKANLIGVSPTDIAELIKEALASPQKENV